MAKDLSCKVTIKINRFPELLKKFPQEVMTVQNKAAYDLMGRSMQNAPVDTGNLKGSHAVVPPQPAMQKKVIVAADYAAAVNYGTRFQAAQPYLTEAIEAVGPGYTDAMRRIAERL